MLALLAALTLVADTSHLVVVATTDVHGRATAWDYETDERAPLGLTRLASLVDSLRHVYPGRVLVVDAGDLIQGNPFATYLATVAPQDPHPILDAMNAIGYDAATPGNHDFNFGLDVMGRSLGSASFPYVSANILRSSDRRPVFPRYVLLERAGVRIGVMGLTTPGVMVWDGKLVAGQVSVERTAAMAGPALATLSRAGADLLIAMIHAGIGSRSSYDTTGVGAENSAERLAGLRVPPNIVVVGHSHRAIADSVIRGVHFVQPRQWAQAATVTHISLERRGTAHWRVSAIRSDLVDLSGFAPAARVAALLEPVHEAVRAWAAVPIGEAVGDFDAAFARAEDSPVIDFVNTVQRDATGAELSATAAFNPAAGFNEGPIRLRDVAALYPYENTLRAVRISGRALRSYLEQSAKFYRTYPFEGSPVDPTVPGYNFDMVSGVAYVIDLSRPPGERITMLSHHGRPIEAADTFTLALNSYRQAGGGGFTMLAGLPVIYDRGENVRDLLVEAIRQHHVIRAEQFFESSWRIEPAEAAAAVREHFRRARRRSRRRQEHRCLSS